MPLSRADGLVDSDERRREIQLVRCVADILGAVVLRREEPLGQVEVSAADQKADLVCGLAQGFGDLEQISRHIEGACALGRVPVHSFETPLCAYAAIGIGLICSTRT